MERQEAGREDQLLVLLERQQMPGEQAEPLVTLNQEVEEVVLLEVQMAPVELAALLVVLRVQAAVVVEALVVLERPLRQLRLLLVEMADFLILLVLAELVELRLPVREVQDQMGLVAVVVAGLVPQAQLQVPGAQAVRGLNIL